MRRFTLALIPVIVMAGSFARAQDSASRVAPAAPPKLTTEWASGGAAPAKVRPAPAITTTGATVVAPGNGGSCGPAGCAPAGCGPAGCGGACAGCGDECCLAKVKTWLCSRPLHTTKRVCYTPIPALYLFFPPVRPGYCPQLAPDMPCPCTGHVTHVVCPRCKKSCGCSKKSCGNNAGECCDAASSCGP